MQRLYRVMALAVALEDKMEELCVGAIFNLFSSDEMARFFCCLLCVVDFWGGAV